MIFSLFELAAHMLRSNKHVYVKLSTVTFVHIHVFLWKYHGIYWTLETIMLSIELRYIQVPLRTGFTFLIEKHSHDSI